MTFFRIAQIIMISVCAVALGGSRMLAADGNASGANPDRIVIRTCSEASGTVEKYALPRHEAGLIENKFTIKSNLPAWAMLWINAAAEYDLTSHLSVQLPVYYSGFNYFRSNVKFRTLATMPELRFWISEENRGFFANIHLGLAWYNCAFGGAHRYQDHSGRTPAIGGGAGIGYRFPISADGRWSLEAALGMGAYSLDYDIFENNHNGMITGRRCRTFFGVDQAALSIGYSFGLKKKGGGR